MIFISPIINRLLQLVEKHPNKIMIYENDQQITFKEAYEKIFVFTRCLEEKSKGRPIILLGENSAEWLFCFFAAIKAGILIIPMPNDTPHEKVKSMARELAVGAIVYVNQSKIEKFDDKSEILLPSKASVGLLTSGSTGSAKLALRSEISFISEGERYCEAYNISNEDTILVALPLNHAFILGMTVGCLVTQGCSFKIVSNFRTREIQRSLRHGEVSLLPIVPALAAILCQSYQSNKENISKLKALIIGAGPVSHSLETLVKEYLRVSIYRNYGSTETGATLGSVSDLTPESITGKPLPGVEVFVRENELDGVLFVRTDTPFIGYWENGRLDSSKVSPEGWFSTGDIANIDGLGFVSILGRKDNVFRRGGKSIFPNELRRGILQHPEVLDAILTSEKDHFDEDVPIAWVLIKEESELDSKQLKEFLKSKLESYKIPTKWKIEKRLTIRDSEIKPTPKWWNRKDKKMIEQENLFSQLKTLRTCAALLFCLDQQILKGKANEEINTFEVARTYKLDILKLRALLEILEASGICIRKDENSFKTIDNFPSILNIPNIKFEAKMLRLFSSSNLARMMMENSCNFSHWITNDQEFQNLYLQVMKLSAKAAALQGIRISKPSRFGLYLEIGRPVGDWTKLVVKCQPFAEIKLVYLPFKKIELTTIAEIGKIQSIYIYNGFRWLIQISTSSIVKELFECIKPGGTLLIADIFTDREDINSSIRKSFALDWICFGNFCLGTGQELIELLELIGFQNLRRVRVDYLFELIIGTKPEIEQ